MHVALTFLKIVYVGHSKPFESPKLNFKEMFNEWLIALAAYPLWVFTDWANKE